MKKFHVNNILKNLIILRLLPLIYINIFLKYILYTSNHELGIIL